MIAFRIRARAIATQERLDKERAEAIATQEKFAKEQTEAERRISKGIAAQSPQ